MEGASGSVGRPLGAQHGAGLAPEPIRDGIALERRAEDANERKSRGLDALGAVEPLQRAPERGQETQAVQPPEAFERETGQLAQDAQKIYVRVNALDTDMTLGDLAAVMPGRPDGIVLPKCAGAADVNRLSLYLDAFEAGAGIEHGSTRIVTVATETARAVLKLLDFENMSPRLWGMMWGAEDLAASLGASRNRTGGRFHGPFLLARDLCLISAAAAGVVAIDTIATDINDLDALREESIAARQDGFLAKAVIHPKHVDVVNAAFMPTDEEIAWSEKS